ncbi:Abi family protein [Maribacter antarcticus]|uniref:Abi family protein n=1 Tax=Maribacter antarcticus TaxID=505250 RepID=UPI00056816C7|nr:Abi family protein [Maribacter antarcticus]
MKKTEYPKKIINLDEQIARLRNRGLIINDDDIAKQYLKNISYFRLQGYWWEFQTDKQNHKFKEGTNFTDVINLYTFDRKLKLLLFDIIERVEIALRTKLVYYPSIELGQWWFEDLKSFHSKDFFNESVREIDKELLRTKEVFVEKHYEKYGSTNRPPAYKTLEVVSFGCLSKIYSNLRNDIVCKNRIASEFDLPNSNFLKSWLLAFNTTRNIIAHHSRLWNRKLHLPPKILGKPNSNFVSPPADPRSMYYLISCLLYVLNKVSPGHSQKEKLKILFKENDFVDKQEMGFPENWEENLLWL